MEALKRLIKQTAAQIDHGHETLANNLGMTDARMSVIDFLSNHKNSLASQNEIEHEFNIKQSTTTIMLQRTGRHGLIIGINDPKDERKKQIQLTESTLRIVPKIRQYTKQDNEEVLDNLSMKDVNIITAFLKNIREGKAND